MQAAQPPSQTDQLNQRLLQAFANDFDGVTSQFNIKTEADDEDDYDAWADEQDDEEQAASASSEQQHPGVLAAQRRLLGFALHQASTLKKEDFGDVPSMTRQEWIAVRCAFSQQK